MLLRRVRPRAGGGAARVAAASAVCGRARLLCACGDVAAAWVPCASAEPASLRERIVPVVAGRCAVLRSGAPLPETRLAVRGCALPCRAVVSAGSDRAPAPVLGRVRDGSVVVSCGAAACAAPPLTCEAADTGAAAAGSAAALAGPETTSSCPALSGAAAAPRADLRGGAWCSNCAACSSRVSSFSSRLRHCARRLSRACNNRRACQRVFSSRRATHPADAWHQQLLRTRIPHMGTRSPDAASQQRSAQRGGHMGCQSAAEAQAHRQLALLARARLRTHLCIVQRGVCRLRALCHRQARQRDSRAAAQIAACLCTGLLRQVLWQIWQALHDRG